jgi:hypothetical protein
MPGWKLTWPSMSATVHSLFSVEAAFLLNPEHADGARLKLMFGLGNYY